MFKVCFWERQFPCLIPFKGCTLQNLVRYLLISVLLLVGKKNVAAAYITWGLFLYRSCSKRQAMWLEGGFGVTHIHYSGRKAFLAQQHCTFFTPSCSKETDVLSCCSQSFLSSHNFWFVAWCSWPCEDLGAVIQVGWSALTTPSACTYYRQISVESNLFAPQGYSLWFIYTSH